MPVKAWDTQEDFEAGTLTNLVATGGTLAISEGFNEGTWRSEWYHDDTWARHSRVRLTNVVPDGCNVALRFRSNTTADDETAWSEWVDGILSDDSIIFDLDTWYENNPGAAIGKYIQFEVRLRGE